jgi:predicted O-methyltransferase YrrM
VGCKFDFIIVDASHQYEDAKNDLKIAWELLKENGTIIGDDFVWPGVRKALDEFCVEYNVQYSQSNYNQFIIKKK